MEFNRGTGKMSQSNPRHKFECNIWQQVWPYTDSLNHLDGTSMYRPDDNPHL